MTAGESASRHLTKVLRLRPGASVQVFDGRGHEHTARLESCDRRGGVLRVGPALTPVPESPLRIRLLQGICRGERMDYVVQKTTELGVAEIQAVSTERSVVKLDDKRARRRLEHWRSVAMSACEQCGRATLPLISPPVPLHQALTGPDKGDVGSLLDAGAATGWPDGPSGVEGVALLIGPEGGLTEADRKHAESCGYRPVSMGPRIMRTETAAVAALALTQSRWGDLSASAAPSL